MSVERRYSKRHPMNGDVYIRYRKQRAFHAKAVNCSGQGMCLKTERLTLLTGALVELEIFQGGRLWEVVGIVTYVQRDNIGVMFQHPQPELYALAAVAQPRLAGIAQPIYAGAYENHP